MVRISGPRAIAVASQVVAADVCAPLEQLRQPTALRGDLQLNLDGALRSLPCDLFVWPTHRSYTRQPVVELHTLGSPPLLETVVAHLCAAGARLAEPGEFTLRAFLAGRIDLTQAEAVLGIIDARRADDLDAALVQLAGGLARPLHRLRDVLLQLLAELEAGLDFVEEDIEFVSREEIYRRLRSAGLVLRDIARQMESRHSGPIERQIVLVGRPNAGKSTLFNALIKKCGILDAEKRATDVAALVSPQSGTTRDYLAAAISLEGIRCELIDTAGFDEPGAVGAKTATETIMCSHYEASTELSDAAKSMAERRHKTATLRLFCIEADICATSNARAAFREAADYDFVVVTKCDLLQPNRFACIPWSDRCVATSGVSGEGLDDLCRTLRAALTSERTAQRGQAVAATAGRCRESIRLAGGAIDRAVEIASTGLGNELLAVELRTALDELGKVVGAIYTDDLLDRIFSTFCIGK
jgi:tRNA modification GTPase